MLEASSCILYPFGGGGGGGGKAGTIQFRNGVQCIDPLRGHHVINKYLDERNTP